MNIGLKNLADWPNANKIYLKVKKTETIIFKCKRKKWCYCVIKLKLNRQWLHLTDNVKDFDILTKLIRVNAKL